jgi:hypothetical protein
MRAILTQSGCTLTREPGDKRISHESTVGYHMKKDLNMQGFHFVRLNPSRHGLTSCKVGLIDRKANIILWHERYAIENAATEYNQGRVFFMRTEAI